MQTSTNRAYDSVPVKNEEKRMLEKEPSSNYDLYAKEIQDMLEYAKVGDYLACNRDQDAWNEVLNHHTDIYPYKRSFDEYDTEWFEKNNAPFVDFLKQVIARETKITFTTVDEGDLHSDGVNYAFTDGSVVEKGMRVGYINDDGKICIDENIVTHGVVKEFKVFATMTTTLCVNVYAVSQSSAMDIAKEIDGGEFVEVEELGEWNVYDATSVEG